MAGFPWFPFGHSIPGCVVGPLRKEDTGYQIIATQGTDKVVLIVEGGSLASKAVEKLESSPIRGFTDFKFGGRSYLSRVFDKEEQPIVVREWPKMMGLPTSSEIAGLSAAIKDLRERFPGADVGRALYLSAYDICIPVVETDKHQDLRMLAVEVLVGGAPITSIDVISIRAINSWLLPEEIEVFLSALGIETAAGHISTLDPASLSLPGRPKLEKFFREYILEPIADRERYTTLGVKTPNGVLLYGPPGSGKSHAVGKLKTALGWPIFEIDLGAMGSPFIHQTSVALRAIFEEAKRKAPALVVMEEVDALASSRDQAFAGPHKAEEVAEILRLVESAAENQILVVGTTNRKDGLDAAIMRKGRFDHVIEVGYPGLEEARAALEGMLQDRPHQTITNIEQISANLADRPMSDIAWVVNEAARLAARGKKDAIDEIDLFSALVRLQKS
jgi:cell division protease FtsH